MTLQRWCNGSSSAIGRRRSAQTWRQHVVSTFACLQLLTGKVPVSKNQRGGSSSAPVHSGEDDDDEDDDGDDDDGDDDDTPAELISLSRFLSLFFHSCIHKMMNFAGDETASPKTNRL